MFQEFKYFYYYVLLILGSFMNIYVGNLVFRAAENDIRRLFAQFGNVLSVKMMKDRETGKARGFCFVHMEDADGEKAINALNGYNFQGRTLKVNEARERTERPIEDEMHAPIEIEEF